MTEFTHYYVLNSLINGERDCLAIPTGGGMDQPQPDGHYFMVEGSDDGVGPYDSREDAHDAWEKATATQYWVFESGELPRPMSEIDADLERGDSAKIEKTSGNIFVCELQGSYETLTVSVSAKDFAHAARVFSGALLQMET